MLLTHSATLILFTALLWLGWTDLRTRRLPDILTLPLAAIGLVFNTLVYDTPIPALLGLVIGYASFWAVEVVFRRLRGIDGLGRGDAKLLAAGGAWCTAWFLPAIALIGAGTALLYVALLALVRRRFEGRLTTYPFGPWLALGIALCWLWRAYGGQHPFPV